MARRRQEGNLFFRLDVDFFSDRKVKILKARYGADGITLYLYLLCEIYKTGYYLKIDRDFEYIVSDDLNMESNKVKQVLNFLLERSLFDNTLFQSDKILTSAGIQRRYQAKLKPEVSHRIYVRFRNDITADMRIKYHGRIFTIEGPPLDIDERHELLEIQCREVFEGNEYQV